MTMRFTTGLVSLLALATASGVAHADMSVKIGGYTDFQAGFFDNDNANSNSHDFQSEAEIYVRAEGTTDAGLTYGAYIELFASTSDTANSDEVNLYFSNKWGRLELGDQDGAGSECAVVSPYVGIGQALGSYNDYVPAADRGYGLVDFASDPSMKAYDTSDATKITYYTPRMWGLQAGVSYAPERDNLADGEGVQLADNVGNHNNAVELGLNYTNTWKEIGIKVGGEYNTAHAKEGSGREDINAWTLGAQFSYNGFTVGGGYTSHGDSGLPTGVSNDDVSGWTAGVTYTTGPWGFGLNYVKMDFDQNGSPFITGATGTGGDYTAIGLGTTYKLVEGVTVGADVVHFDRHRITGADNDGYVVVTEVRANF